MESIQLIIRAEKFNHIEELATDEQLLFKNAREAMENAYAPYSGFNVGAAVILSNGEIIAGNNQENTAFPTSICAERVAIFSASAKFPNEQVNKIAIVANSKSFELNSWVAPCGSCRQVIAETEQRFQSSVKILFGSLGSEIYAVNSVKELLPFMFYEKGLKKH